MSQVLVTEQYLDDIADAIRSKNGSENTYTPAQMAGAIENIHTADATSGGGGGTLSRKATYRVGDENGVIVESELSQTIEMHNQSTDFIIPTLYGMNYAFKKNEPFEISCKFKILNAPTSIGEQIWGGVNDYYYYPSIAVYPDKIVYFVTTNGLTWQYGVVPITPSGYTTPVNTIIIARLTFDGTNISFYVNDGSNEYTAELENVTPSGGNFAFEFGGQNRSQYSIAKLGCVIYLDETYIKVDGDTVWPVGVATLVSKTVTQNGTYNASGDNADGYSSVIVNVQGGGSVELVPKTITQNGTYNASGDNADGYSSVTVNVPNGYSASDEGKVVSGGALVGQTSRNVTMNGTYDTTENNEVVVNVSGGSSSGDAFAEFDFSKLTGTIWNVAYGTSGGVFNNNGGYILLPFGKPDMTIEIDVSQMQLSSGTHRRFIMGSSDKGLIYRSNGVWAFYSGSWQELVETSGSFFDNSTVRVYIDASNYWHIYRNGILFFEPTSPLPLDYATPNKLWSIGSRDGESINNAIIKAVRLYDGEYTG